jgi:hypothetical protein
MIDKTAKQRTGEILFSVPFPVLYLYFILLLSLFQVLINSNRFSLSVYPVSPYVVGPLQHGRCRDCTTMNVPDLPVLDNIHTYEDVSIRFFASSDSDNFPE